MRQGSVTRETGRRIALFRRNRRGGLLSQERLAARVGVSLSTLRKVESGERSASVGLVEAVARELGTTVHALLCGGSPADPLDACLAPFVRLIRRHGLTPRQAQAVSRLLGEIIEEFCG